jgi:drug/metabolite transporter (DMT)-like permease
MLALGALGTGAANVMVATAAGRTNAIAASAMGFIIPAVALLLGVLVRDEHVQLLSIFGAFTCVVGAALLARTSTPKLDAISPEQTPERTLERTLERT